MRRLFLVLVVAAAIPAIAGYARGEENQPAVGTVALSPVHLGARDFYHANAICRFSRDKPDSLKDEIASGAEVHYCEIHIAGEMRGGALFGFPGAPVLSIDADCDGSLKGEKALPVDDIHPREPTPFTILINTGGETVRRELEFVFLGGDAPQYIKVRNRFALAGELSVSGKTYDVRLIDSNHNGTYGDIGEPPNYHNGDRLLVEGGVEDFEFPLTRNVLLAGNYYKLEFNETVETLTLLENIAEKGTLALKAGSGSPWCLIYSEGDYYFRVDGGNLSCTNEIPTPAATYTVRYSGVQIDTAKEKWRTRILGQSTTDKITVATGDTTTLEIPDTYTTPFENEYVEDENAFILHRPDYRTSDGRQVFFDNNGRSIYLTPLPFVITDAGGKVVEESHFDFG